MRRLKFNQLILAVSLIVGLLACENLHQESLSGRIKEKTITESEALDLISKTYESAYIQGMQDVLNKWIEEAKSGYKEKLSVEYFMDLKDKRLKDFLAGNPKGE